MKLSILLLSFALGGPALSMLAQAQTPSPTPANQPPPPPSSALPNGFDGDNLLALTPAWQTANPSETMWTFLQRVRQLPGVSGAAVVFPPPFLGIWPAVIHRVEGRPISTGQDLGVTGMWVTDGFFEMVRTPLLEGRLIAPADRQATPRAAVVNASFARRFFGARSPVGKTIECEFPGGDSGAGKRNPYVIAGVVADARYADLLKEPHPMVFFCSSRIQAGYCVVRPSGSLPALTNALAKLARQIEPGCANMAIFPLRQRENPGRETLAY